MEPIIFVIGVVVTWLFGPLAFFYISEQTTKHTSLHKFPHGPHEVLGHTLFLPWFNGYLFVLFSRGFELVSLYVILAAVLGFLFSSLFMFVRRDVMQHNDWMRFEKHEFTSGGWYHQFFLVIESLLLVVGLLLFADAIWLWFPFVAYVSVLCIDWYLKR